MNLTKVVTTAVFVAFFVSAFPSFADEVHFLFLPCRVLDTRNTSIGLVTANTQIEFNVREASTNPGGPQGGASGCAVPKQASGVVLSLIAVTPTGNGHVYLWPADSTQPASSVLNFSGSTTINDSLFVRLADFGEPDEIALKPSTSGAYFVADIVAWVGAADTTMVQGLIIDKQGDTTPPSVQFELEDSARSVICAEPWIDPALCDQYDEQECIAVTGHISPSYSFNKLYVHTITECN